jgi:pimeloyl-ACP methyl ester carboxylesterase
MLCHAIQGHAESGAALLLHGFGASSYMFRELIPVLAQRYHVIAPDLPGFGQTTVSDTASPKRQRRSSKPISST